MNKSLGVFLSILVASLTSLSAISASDLDGPGPQSENQVLTLQEAVRMALAHSPEVSLAGAQALRAGEAVRETRSLKLPQVSTGTGAAVNNGYPLSFEGAAPSIVQISASQAILSKKNSSLIKQAEEAGKSSGFGAESARDDVASKTALTYYQLHQARKRIEIASARLEILKNQQEQVGILFAAGRVIKHEADQAEHAVFAAQNQLNAAQEQAQLAEKELREFTGFSQIASIKTVEPQIENPIFDTPSDTIYLRALECTPEILKSKADLKAKEMHVEAEKAERLPKLEIVGEYAVFSKVNNYADYYKSFSRNNFLLGASIQVPVFNGFRTSSRVAESRHEVSEANYRLESQKSDLKLNIERSSSALRIAQGDSAVARSDVKIAEDMVQLNQTLLDTGRISPKDMDDSRSLLQQKQMALLQAEELLFQRKLELLRVAGSISSALQ